MFVVVGSAQGQGGVIAEGFVQDAVEDLFVAIHVVAEGVIAFEGADDPAAQAVFFAEGAGKIAACPHFAETVHLSFDAAMVVRCRALADGIDAATRFARRFFQAGRAAHDFYAFV